MFKVSDKVVRVTPLQPDDGRYRIDGAPMVVGQVYTVEAVEPFWYSDGRLHDGIYLTGCGAFWKPRGEYVPWASQFFRKLEEVQEGNRKAKQEPVEA